jgi:hypothetical protein
MHKRIAVLACLLTVGCVSTSVQRLEEVVRPARAPETVAVLLEAPEQPYTVIAVIESKNGSVFDSFDDMREAMVAEAAELGGDAVILGSEDTDERFILTGTAMIKSDERRMRCEVIVYGSKGA